MPIKSDNQDSHGDIAIRLVESPLTIRDLLPKYQYQFQSGSVSDESTEMYNEILDFLVTNEELAVNDSYTSRDDYTKGFQRAIAIVKLWIDSIYLQTNSKE